MSEPSARVTDLSPHNRRALLSQLLRQKARHAAAELPLSYGQQALWLTHQLAPQSWAYNVLFAARVRSRVETAALHQAFQTLLERHPILRTTYTTRQGQPAQQIHAHVPVAFEVIDAAAWSDQALHDRLITAARQPFDLEQGPLLRVRLFTRTATEHVLLLVIHHIAVDIFALGVILAELRELYAAARAGREASLPPPDRQYTDFVRWQAELLAGPEGERLWAYWQQQLAGALPELQLPTERPRPPVQTYHGASHTFALGAKLTQQLKALAQAEGATLYMTLLAAFYVLLHRYTGQDDLLIGTFTADRVRPEFRRVVGYFVNPVVVRAALGGNPPFRTFLRQVRQTVLAALKHQDFPFPLLVERLQPARHASRSPLFQVAFVLQQLHGQQELLHCFVPGATAVQIDFGGLVLEPLALPQQEGQFDLTLEMAGVGETLWGALKYNSDLFEVATIARMAGHLQTLLEGIVTNPEQSLSSLPLLTAAERQQLLAAGNASQTGSVAEQCLHTWFEAQAERTPDAVAVVYADLQLTYRELNRRTNQLAHYLQSLGVGPDVLVGIFAERSLELVLGLLGILKAGGAYVPLDPAYPQERLRFMLEDAQVSVLLTQQRLAASLPEHRAQVVYLDASWDTLTALPAWNPHSGVTVNNLAYAIYTSGSTGQPKGALISHRNVVRLFTATHDWFHFDTGDVWTLFHSCAFDFSVWEIWGALLYGGRLVVVPFWVSRSPAAFYDLLRREQVTVLNQTPSAFRQLIQAEADAGELPQGLALRLVILGGEALDVQSLQPWFVRHGDTRPQVVNMYGITETTVHVTYCPLTMADVRETSGSPIGRPLPDLHIYVLDAERQLVPIGVPGELYVGGAGVARGYLYRAELTAQKFLPNPFGPDAAARLYRSGDLGRYLPNGTLEYFGRLDQQVKIRGFRIELGEIETVLGQHPGVREVAVLARADSSGEKRLVAYVVPGRQATLTPEAIRGFLESRLPDYMIPAAFVVLDALPLTPHGKVDRRALPAPGPARPALAHSFVAPRSAVEQALADIFGQVLGIQQVGVHDSFFALGGDSIRSVQVQAKARESGLHFSLPQLFQRPTIAALARVIRAARSGESELPQSAAFSLIAPEDRRRLPADVEDAYPLTMLQAEMLSYSQHHPDAPVYYVMFSYHIRARFEAQAWRTAWQHLGARHAMLRTSFDLTSFSTPLQLVHRLVQLPLEVEELRSLPAAQQDKALTVWRHATMARPFDWQTPPLLRVSVHRCSEATFWCTLRFHHAILDGWSVAVMLTELFRHYMALLENSVPPPVPPLTLTYRDFVAQERHALRSEACQQYWDHQLQNLTMTRLPHHTASPPTPDAVSSADLEMPVLSEVFTGLQNLARHAAVPLKSVLLAAHLQVLGWLSKQPEVLTGLMTHGRPEEPDAERVLGLFLNVLPLRLRLPTGSWQALVQATFQAEQELLPFRHYPIAHLPESRHRLPVFETVFNFIHFHVYQGLRELPGFEYITGKFFDPFPYTLKANFVVNPLSSQLLLSLNYNQSKLHQEHIQTIGQYYTNALTALAMGSPREFHL